MGVPRYKQIAATSHATQSLQHKLTRCIRGSGQGVKDGQKVPGQLQALMEVVVYAAQLDRQKSAKGVNSAQQTRDTTTEARIAWSNSTWHVCKYRVNKLHKRYILTSTTNKQLHETLSADRTSSRTAPGKS